MDEWIDLITGPADYGMRLDVFLSGHLRISRSIAARMIEQGLVEVDGRAVKPSLKLKDGMRISGRPLPSPPTGPPGPRDIPLDVIYEDEWIAVLDKPAGLTVHPGAGNSDNTLVNALLARYPQIAGVGDPDRPGIVHRLDKMTSGVMVVALGTKAHAALIDAFRTHAHRREYLAVIYGHMPQPEGSIETYMQRNPRDRKKMTSRTTGGRKAVTRWKVMKEWKGFSLLLLSLLTGRTHQIRVHLSDMGHPVAGDAQYGGKRRDRGIDDMILQAQVRSLGRQMLHACTLGIVHPVTGQDMEFRSEMPRDMKAFIKMLDERDGF